MIRIIDKIPNTCFLACSGGVDSMVCLDFLLKGKKSITVAHFDHGTDFGKEARFFLEEYCSSNNIPIVVGKIKTLSEPGKSKEEHWRNERYEFFHSLSGTVVTAHNLNDVIEWWIFSSLHGTPRVIPYCNGNVIRPFMLTSRPEIERWANKNNVPYLVDPGNSDERYMRSIIRQKMVPEAFRVNQGLYKVIRRKVKELCLE